MNNTISAFTDITPETYPPYYNLSGSGEKFTLSVRSAGNPGGATIGLTLTDLQKFHTDISNYLKSQIK